MTKNNRTTLLHAIIFLSGFTFLVYEVSWFRMIALMTGATVRASTIILVAFMAGFGWGAWYWGRKALASSNPIRLIMLQLLVIAGIGVISYTLIHKGLAGVYSILGQLSFSAGSMEVTVLGISMALLLIPSFFMGGILPVITGSLALSDKGLSGVIGKAYAWETLGSALGGLAAGTVLIRWFGQQYTLYLAALLNIVSFAILFLAAKPVELPAGAAVSAKVKGESRKGAEKAAFPVLLTTFLFGFAVFGLQVVWFRIFRIYLTNTSYTFALIASMVILGLFMGSRYFAVKGGRQAGVRTLPRLLALTALMVMIGLGILIKLPEWVMFPLAGEQDAYFARIIVLPVISAILIILPVTILSGYAFPLTCRLYTNEYREVSQSMGQVLLYNTAGSILGPLVSAFLFIPLRGAGLSVILYAAILLAGVFMLATRMERHDVPSGWRGIAAGIAIVLLVAGVVSPKIKILPPSFVKFERKILDYRETMEGTWVVGQEPGGRGAAIATYVNNSAVIGSSYDAIKVVKMVGHLPFYAGLKCRDALVVGFGIGVTTSAIASHPEVERIDCVELVGGIKDAAHFYSGLNYNVQADKRLTVRSGDGRQYLQSTSRTYDLISSDPTHPILGSGSLYTREYFELCRKHLNPGGMVSQYLPLHKLLPADFQSIIQTFHSVFPHSTVWLGHNHAVLLGSTKPLKIDFSQWSHRIATMEKDPYFYNDPYHLAACLVLDGASISRFPASVKVLTDDRPLTEFFRLSSFSSRNLVVNLEFLNQNRPDLNHTFTAIPDPERMKKFLEGNRLLTLGVAMDLEGNRKGYLQKLREASVVNPENQEFPFLLQFNSGR